MPHLIWNGKKHSEDDLSNDTQYIDNLQETKLKSNIQLERYDFTLKKPLNKDNKRNLLIHGPNKYVMNKFLKEFVGKVNLIYIDPPFATGGNFYYKIHIGSKNFTKSAEAYSDQWKKGMDSYLSFLYERLILMKKLLSEDGSIYIQLDWHVSHYVKLILDELFGRENFRNEIIWSYPAASAQTRRFFIRSYDVILFYTKTEKYCFNDDPNIYMEYSNRVKNALKKDEKGIFYYRGGSHDGKKLARKVYVKEQGIFPRDVWNDIPYIRANTREYQGFSTQKPERLLKRIILASSNENGLIADFFCGTGTTLIVAEKLNRRWIGVDIAKHAIDIARKRVLNIAKSNDLFKWNKCYNSSFKPFDLIKINKGNLNLHTLKFFVKNQFQTNKKLNFKEKPDFKIKINIHKKKVWVELKQYNFPFMNLLKDDIREHLSSFDDLIDYWAVDFNYNNNFFNTDWCSYKILRDRKISLISKSFSYSKTSEYQIRVKVVNIFGQESIQTYPIKID